MPAPKFSGSAEIAFLTDWGLAPFLKLKRHRGFCHTANLAIGYLSQASRSKPIVTVLTFALRRVRGWVIRLASAVARQYAQAACHAARARVDRVRGRSPPRARPGSGLLGRTEAEPVRPCACSPLRPDFYLTVLLNPR